MAAYYSNEVSIEFDAAHRVREHEGKCAHIHGHHYKVVLTLQGHLDPVGRVLDFGIVRSDWKKLIDETIDHGVILSADDIDYGNGLLKLDAGTKICYVPVSTTAETLAAFLYLKLSKICPVGTRISRVDVWETPNCCGSFTKNSLSAL